MKLRQAIVFFGLFGLISATARAEEEKAFTRDHRSFFSLLQLDPSDMKLRYYLQPNNDEDGGPGSFDLQEFQGKFEIPLPLDDDFYFRFGLEYGAKLLDFDNVESARTNAGSETLHKGVLSTGAGAFLSENLLLTGVVRLGLYSDFDETPDDNDFDIQGDAMIVYRINPGAQVLAGIARTQVFDDLTVYPLFGIRLLGEDGALKVGITFPQEIRVSYNFEKDFQVYSGVWITGDEYRIDLGEVDDRFDVHVQDRRWGVGALYWFDENFNVVAEGGVSLGGEFKLATDDPGQFDGDVDPAGYVSAGIGASF